MDYMIQLLDVLLSDQLSTPSNSLPSTPKSSSLKWSVTLLCSKWYKVAMNLDGVVEIFTRFADHLGRMANVLKEKKKIKKKTLDDKNLKIDLNIRSK